MTYNLLIYFFPSGTTPNSLYFFFSSRRRHTRSKRDWSSDVCSSDLRVSSRTARWGAPGPGGAGEGADPPGPGARLLHGLEVVVVRFLDAGEHLVRRGRSGDQTLYAGHQDVVVPGRRPVRVERQAVVLHQGVPVGEQFLVLRVGDLRCVRRNRDAAGVAEQVLDLRAHRDVD